MKDTTMKVAGGALAFGLMAPGMAFAADADHTPAVTGEDVKVTASEDGSGSEGTTAVTWVADDSQLDITVPNTIHVVAKADGTLMVPTNAAITNNSVFAVHGTKYATADAGITLVEDVDAEDGSKDVMEMQVTATGAAMQMGPAGTHTIAAEALNLNKAGVDGNAVTLGLAGKVKLANDPATVPTDAFTIAWHFEAGLNGNFNEDYIKSRYNLSIPNTNASITGYVMEDRGYKSKDFLLYFDGQSKIFQVEKKESDQVDPAFGGIKIATFENATLNDAACSQMVAGSGTANMWDINKLKEAFVSEENGTVGWEGSLVNYTMPASSVEDYRQEATPNVYTLSWNVPSKDFRVNIDGKWVNGSAWGDTDITFTVSVNIPDINAFSGSVVENPYDTDVEDPFGR